MFCRFYFTSIKDWAFDLYRPHPAVFGNILGVPFDLNPAALQILYLFMEQYLGPITVQDKYENRFD
jgi:hypothetical protein